MDIDKQFNECVARKANLRRIELFRQAYNNTCGLFYETKIAYSAKFDIFDIFT